jgi:uncharacterized protein YecT (DUF1311 family)/uncharacterized protein YgiM (DUF1202 family)
MTHIKARFLTIASLSSLLCLNPLTQAANKTIWQGQSGGLDIHWTEANITAIQGTKILFSAEALARKAFEKKFLGDSGKGAVCEYQRTFSLLSVVGNVASMKDTLEQHCQAIMKGYHRFTTVDLANPEKRVELTDFFPESVILKALLADTVIDKTLTNAGIKTTPSTLEALYLFLDKQTLIARDTEEGGKCQFILSEDFLTQFAFHHVNGNRIAVRMTLSPATAACRWSHAQLGIYLPIPSTFKVAFMQAQKGQVGFLMDRVNKMAGNTTVHFSTDTYTPLPEKGTRITTVSKASLRSTPKVRKGNLLTKLKKGDVLKTLGRTSFQEENSRYHKDYWYLVELENGKTGWIFGALTKRVDKKTGYPVDSRKTTDTETNVHFAPNVQTDTIEILGKGVIVEVLARSKHQNQIDNILDYWYQVELANGKIGWVFGGQIMATDEKITTGSRVNVRSEPTLQGSLVKTLHEETQVDILARSRHQDKIGKNLDYWYKVQSSDGRDRKTGWVFGGLLMRSSMRMVMGAEVRMRSEAHRGASVVKTLDEGAIVYAHKRSKHQEKFGDILDYWYEVGSADNKIGWIFGGFIMSVGYEEIMFSSFEDDAEEPPCHIPWILPNPAINECARISYEAADGRLNQVYQQITTLLDSDQYRQDIIEMESPLYPYGEQKQLLIEAQRSWILFRDKQCNLETFFNRGGTGFTSYESGCLERLTTQRIETLVEYVLKKLKGEY